MLIEGLTGTAHLGARWKEIVQMLPHIQYTTTNLAAHHPRSSISPSSVLRASVPVHLVPVPSVSLGVNVRTEIPSVADALEIVVANLCRLGALVLGIGRLLRLRL